MKRVVWIAYFCLLTSPVLAESSLQSYFNKALLNDPEFLAARASYAAEVEGKTIARAGLLPSLDLTIDANRNQYQRVDVGSPAIRNFDFDSTSVGIRLNQPLFDLERWARYQEGDAQAARAAIVLADARQNLVLRLAEAYFDYLMAFDTLALSSAQAQAVTAQRIRAENLYRGGAATVTDVEESKAREQLAKVQEFVAKNEIEKRRKALSKLIGEMPKRKSSIASPESTSEYAAVQRVFDRLPSEIPSNNLDHDQAVTLRLTPDLTLNPSAAQYITKNTVDAKSRSAQSPVLGTPKLEFPQPNALSYWADAARSHNLRVQSSKILLAIADYQRDRSRAGYFPKLSLVAIYQTSQNANYLTQQDKNARVGVQLSMNLFAGGATQGADRQSQAQFEKTKQDLALAVGDAEIAAGDAFLGVISSIAQVKALKQAFISAEITLHGMEIGQKVGLRTNSEVLNAQQQLFSTKRDMQQAGYDYLFSRLSLQAAIGALNDEEIASIGALLTAP